MDIDFKEYQLRCELHGHEDDVRGITVCAGDGGIATSSRDKTVRLWTQENRKFVSSKVLVGHTSFVGPITWIPPNPDLPHGGVASGGMDTLVLVWDLNTGEKVQTLKGHQLQVTGIAFDDGDLVSSSIDSTLRRWRSGQCIETWEAHKGPIQAVIKLPTGELVTGSSDTTLKTWKGKTCLHTFVGHSDTVRGLAVMSDLGILSASHDGSLRLCAVSGDVLMEMVGHTAIVYSVDLHVSGLIVSGSEDRYAKIWKDGVCVQSIEHPGCVWDTKFMEYGDIVTACSDGIVRIWTVNQDYFAGQLELDLYNSQLSQYKSSRKRVGGLKLEELPTLDAPKIPDNSYDVADKWLLKESLPLSFCEQVVQFILQNTGQKDIIFDASFRDLYTGSNAYVPGQHSHTFGIFVKPTFKHIPKEKQKLSLTELDVSTLDAIVKTLKDTSYYHSSRIADSEIALLLMMPCSWPITMIFPVVDIVRMVVLHPDGAIALHKHFEFEKAEVLLKVCGGKIQS